MKGCIKIEVKEDRYASCICCAPGQKATENWGIEFTLNHQTTSIRLCKSHLQELKDEVDRALI